MVPFDQYCVTPEFISTIDLNSNHTCVVVLGASYLVLCTSCFVLRALYFVLCTSYFVLRTSYFVLCCRPIEFWQSSLLNIKISTKRTKRKAQSAKHKAQSSKHYSLRIRLIPSKQLLAASLSGGLLSSDNTRSENKTCRSLARSSVGASRPPICTLLTSTGTPRA